MNTTNWARNLTALLIWLVLCSACALPMQQLVDEALVTGDWSEVEQREAAALRRQAKEPSMQCGSGEVGYCKTTGRTAKRVCTCERYADVWDALPQEPISDFP